MGQFIEDPESGRKAKVNIENKLEVDAVNSSEQLHRTELGHGYNINTGLIALTNSTVTPIVYFENHEDHAVVIESIAVGIDDLGTHTGTPVVTLIRNPTSIDFSTAVDMKQNRNFASSSALKSTTLVYKGAAGDTVTGGSNTALFLQQEATRLFANINFVLGVGNSLCITIDAQVTAGTTQVYCALIMYVAKDEL
jgi:hypothetical protein